MKITKTITPDENCVSLNIHLSASEFDSLFVVCDDCGDVVLKSEAVKYDGLYYCSDCVTNCFECGCLIPYRFVYDVADSEARYCQRCWHEYTYVCNDCGSHFRYEDSVSRGWDDEYYCDECYDDHAEALIDEYHTMKRECDITFFGEESRLDTPYMGIELEVDATESVNLKPAIDYLQDEWGDFLHQEHDGSLNYGFENITMPASLNYHLAVIDKYRETFSYLVSCGLRGHDVDTAGIHVHIDRRFFGKHQDSSIAKLLFIFERFRDDLQKFARRTDYQLERWARSRKAEASGAWIKKAVKDAKEYPSYEDRYHSVNLCNYETIEIRIFRSTLNIETFEAIIRFVNRLAFIARDMRAVDIAGMSFEDLLGDDTCIRSYWSRISGGER